MLGIGSLARAGFDSLPLFDRYGFSQKIWGIAAKFFSWKTRRCNSESFSSRPIQRSTPGIRHSGRQVGQFWRAAEIGGKPSRRVDPSPQKQNKDLLRSVQPLMDDVVEGRQGAWKRTAVPGRPSPHRSANPVIRLVPSLGFPHDPF